MRIKASGRSALILATGLWVCFAGPSQAAAGVDGAAVSSKPARSKPESAKPAPKHASHHWKKVAHRKSGKVALKSAASSQAPAKAAAIAEDDGAKPSALPPSVANANAQLASADTPAGAAKSMSARASTILRAAPDGTADAKTTPGTQVVSADQLNDVDRALHDSTPPVLALASADPSAARVMASGNDNSIWDKTSLIGKLFMAFGVMLTMASAARMFMA
jgi:hypothetical protein